MIKPYYVYQVCKSQRSASLLFISCLWSQDLAKAFAWELTNPPNLTWEPQDSGRVFPRSGGVRRPQ